MKHLNKTAIAAALTLASATPAFAVAPITVFGKVNVSVELLFVRVLGLKRRTLSLTKNRAATRSAPKPVTGPDQCPVLMHSL